MNADELDEWLKRGDAHRTLLGDYAGAYSLGVTIGPAGEAALLLRIEGDASWVPPQIEINGRRVVVRAEGGFAPPRKV
jgi:hypothetical protein